jgi:DNA-binding transcriptional LysR family regulator
MQLTHIRKSDLNLLPALAALLEERSVSRAAARHHLSQPAMSRLLQRLRGTFGDELLVRTREGYVLTDRARLLQEELARLLPHIDKLLRGETFDPATAEHDFRLCCPDYLSLLFAPRLAERMSALAPRTTLEVVTWHEAVFERTARGEIDAVLLPNRQSPLLKSEEVFRSEMVCVVASSHPLAKRRMTVKAYLSFPHVMVSAAKDDRTMVNEQLRAAGHRRQIGMRVPYFGSAVLAVEKTTMIATVPRAAALLYAREAKVRLVAPPFTFEPIRILMSWHPSTDGEPAQRWFRNLVREIGAHLA